MGIKNGMIIFTSDLLFSLVMALAAVGLILVAFCVKRVFERDVSTLKNKHRKPKK